MTLKRIGLVLFFALFLSIIFFVFQTDKSARISSPVVQPIKKKPLKKRDLILGQPQFVKSKQTDFAMLKKHIEKQWALKDISILKAWEILEEKKKKTPLTVAVVDTGIHKRHPCLKNNLWKNSKEVPNNGKDDDQNGFIDDIHGWNFVHNNNDIQDYHGHGTHVSGIIAAQGSTSKSPECKIVGVAPHVRIMTLKYFDEGAESSDNIKNTIKSIKYAVQNGADIINYSGGGPGANTDEKTIIAKAADKNIIFVAALGNEGSEIGKNMKYYPASYELPNVLFVLSQTRSKGGNKIVESSNRQKFNYLESKQSQNAPGENIISTLPPRMYLQSHLGSKVLRSLASATIKHNHYGRMTGTSQATAVATGVVALVKTLYPSWSMAKIINQVDKTGFGQEAEKIKEATNQGKKLSAYEALIMRDGNVDLSDQIDNTNTIIPHAPDKVDSLFKNPRRPRQQVDTYDPNKKEESKSNQFQILEDIANFNKKKSK